MAIVVALNLFVLFGNGSLLKLITFYFLAISAIVLKLKARARSEGKFVAIAFKSDN